MCNRRGVVDDLHDDVLSLISCEANADEEVFRNFGTMLGIADVGENAIAEITTYRSFRV